MARFDTHIGKSAYWGEAFENLAVSFGPKKGAQLRPAPDREKGRAAAFDLDAILGECWCYTEYSRSAVRIPLALEMRGRTEERGDGKENIAMRAVIQRVKRAEVRVDGRAVGTVGAGLLVLLGVGKEDTLEAAE